MIRKGIMVLLATGAAVLCLVSAIGIPASSICEVRSTPRTWLVLGGSGSYVEFLYSHLSINPNYNVREQEMVFLAWREPKTRWLDTRLNDWWPGRWQFDCVVAEPTFQGGTEMRVNIGLPLWVLAALLGLYPFVACTRGRLLRRRRRKRGLCIACGYGLTGNPTGVCPECSRKIEADS